MTGAISGTYSYYGAYNFRMMSFADSQRVNAIQTLQNSTSILAGRKVRSPEMPVEPVRPVMPINREEVPAARLGPVIREGADPAEMAVRMRIQQPSQDPAQGTQQAQDGAQPGNGLKAGPEGAQAAVEEGECQTCENRKYQDGSDDMGVSFQTPTNIAPEQVASAVRGHENEHVVREQAKARMEDRKVVSQSVTLHTDICPECGKVYISGGTTRTVTKANNQPEKVESAREKGEKAPSSVFA